jgi:cytochrome b
MRTKPFWDPLLRLLHWGLASCFMLNSAVTAAGKTAHQYVGYTAATLVLIRIVWGFIGSDNARFARFVPTPARLLRYLHQRIHGQAPRFRNHNPAGAVMMLTLLALIAGLAFTGWLGTTDTFWGEAWLADLHAGLANLTLVLVGLHVAAALHESWLHRENLILAMINGQKRP